MVIYLLNICITVALAWLVEHTREVKNSRGKEILFFIMILFPTVISGLRGVGTDYWGYKLRYDKILDGVNVDFDGTDLTGIFYKIIKTIGTMLFGYQSIIFIFSFLTIGIAFYIFYKLRTEISFTFAVFSYLTLLYLYSFNLFRQFLSAELFMLALLFYKKQKEKHFIIIPIILSVIIHSSSIIYLSLFLVILTVKKNIKIRICIYMCAVGFIAIIPYLASWLEKFTDILPHYAYYFLHFNYMGLGVGIFRYILLVWIPIYFISHKKRMFTVNISSEYPEFIFVTMMGSIFSLLSYVSDTFLYRIGYTGLCALPIILSIFVKRIKRHKILFTFFLVIVEVAFMSYDFFYLNTGEIVPYEFFWR